MLVVFPIGIVIKEQVAGAISIIQAKNKAKALNS